MDIFELFHRNLNLDEFELLDILTKRRLTYTANYLHS